MELPRDRRRERGSEPRNDHGVLSDLPDDRRMDFQDGISAKELIARR